MLAKADIDAVAIITTSGEHCWQIEVALDAGKLCMIINKNRKRNYK